MIQIGNLRLRHDPWPDVRFSPSRVIEIEVVGDACADLVDGVLCHVGMFPDREVVGLFSSSVRRWRLFMARSARKIRCVRYQEVRSIW
jgi:hypothetical protein